MSAARTAVKKKKKKKDDCPKISIYPLMTAASVRWPVDLAAVLTGPSTETERRARPGIL